MENITAKLDGNILTLTIDVTKRLRKSNSQKTILVATSGGNKPIEVNDGRVYLGLNCYVKND